MNVQNDMMHLGFNPTCFLCGIYSFLRILIKMSLVWAIPCFLGGMSANFKQLLISTLTLRAGMDFVNASCKNYYHSLVKAFLAYAQTNFKCCCDYGYRVRVTARDKILSSYWYWKKKAKLCFTSWLFVVPSHSVANYTSSPKLSCCLSCYNLN